MPTRKSGAYKIFICYRTADHSYGAASIHRELIHRFGKRKVFRDTDGLEPSADYPDAIRDALASSKVLVAVIGPDWLTLTDENGCRLLDKEDDWVHRELAQALDRDIVVLPILLNGTGPVVVMPQRHELPSPIERLADKQAISVDQRSLARDLKRVSAEIHKMGKVWPRRWRWSVLVGATVAVAVAAVAVIVILTSSSTGQYSGDPARIDPCTFANWAENSLSRAGSAHIDPYGDNFNKCDLLFEPTAGQSETDIKFALELPGAEDDAPVSTEHIGSVTVKKYNNSACERVLSQSTRYELEIIARFDEDDKPSNLCAIVDTATDEVVTSLNDSKEFQLRNPDPKSLVHVQACGLLDAPTLTSFGLATAGEPDVWNWLCRWDSTSGLDVSLRFDRGVRGALELESFGRFSGYTEPSGDDDSGDNCLVSIEYRQLPIADPEYETVRVAVYGQRPVEALCDVARHLAQDTAMNLT